MAHDFEKTPVHGWLEMLILANERAADAIDSAVIALDFATRGDTPDPDVVTNMRQELEQIRAKVDDQLKRFQAAHDMVTRRHRQTTTEKE